MAIQLQHEINETGITGNQWVLVAMHVHRQGVTNSFTLAGTYQLWASSAAYSGGKRPVGQSVQATTGVLQGNPTLGQLQAALDAAVTAQGAPLEGGVIV